MKLELKLNKNVFKFCKTSFLIQLEWKGGRQSATFLHLHNDKFSRQSSFDQNFGTRFVSEMWSVQLILTVTFS